MRSKLFNIDPKSIVLDLPVDANNVSEIERQALAWGGIHTPVEVWIRDEQERKRAFDGEELDPSQKFLLADGFHRTTVAIKTGMATISAILFDCSEEQFWDKRISQAKKHHVVKDERLHAWMISSWQNSEFAAVQRDQEFSDIIYLIHQSLIGAHSVKLSSTSSGQQGKKILEWFSNKANMWGKNNAEVARIILLQERIISPQFPEAPSIAADAGLNAKQTKKLTESFPRGTRTSLSSGLNRVEMVEYAREVVAKNEDMDPLAWKAKKEEQKRTADRRQREFYNTPAGEAEKRKRRIENAAEAVSGLRIVQYRIGDVLGHNLDELIAEKPEVAAKIDAFIGKARELAEKLGRSIEAVNGSGELHALREKVRELELQLATERLNKITVGPESMVMDSTQFN